MEVKSGFRKRPTIRVKQEQKEGKPQKLLSQQAHIFYYSNTKENQEETQCYGSGSNKINIYKKDK